MRLRLCRLVLLTLILFLPSYAAAGTYYVSTTYGNDTNLGTSPDQAWQTIAKVNSSNFNPGDMILFKRGDAWREQLSIPSSGSSLTNTITFGHYSTGNAPIISGADFITQWSAFSGNIYRATFLTDPNRVWHNSYEMIKNKGHYRDLKYNQYDWYNNMLYINIGRDPTDEIIEAGKRDYCIFINQSYIIIDGLHLTKANNSNIGNWDDNANYVTIQNSIIDYAGHNGIYGGQDTDVHSDYWTIKNNVIRGNGVLAMLDHGIYFNYAHDHIIEGNMFYFNKSAGILFQKSAKNNIIKYNFSKGNGNAFVIIYNDVPGESSDNKIFYNISDGDYTGIYIGFSCVNNMIYNNVFFNYLSVGIFLEMNDNVGEIKNNVFWSSAPGAAAIYADIGAYFRSDNNDLGPEVAGFIKYYGAEYNTLGEYQGASFQDGNSISSDPGFTNPDYEDFSLKAISPCRDVGDNNVWSGMFNVTDFEGNLISDADGQIVAFGGVVDVGAFEYQNKAPIANDDAYSVVGGGAFAVESPGLLANDTDAESDALTCSLVNGPNYGTLSVNTDGSFTYIPETVFTGTDSFTYKANDGMVDSNVATVTITVGAGNNPPIAGNDSYSVDRGGTLNVAAPGVLGNDSDADSDTLSAVLVVGGGPFHGSLNLNSDGSFDYTHDGSQTTSDSFAYQATDSNAVSNVATVSITVNPVNDAPVASEDEGITKEGAAITINVVSNDIDVDGAVDPTTVAIVADPFNGTAVANGDGTITYTPNSAFVGNDSLEYTVKDDLGATSNEATVTITVIRRRNGLEFIFPLLLNML